MPWHGIRYIHAIVVLLHISNPAHYAAFLKWETLKKIFMLSCKIIWSRAKVNVWIISHICSCRAVNSIASYSGIILGMGSANERERYVVTASLIGWTPAQNDPWYLITLYQDSVMSVSTAPSSLFLPRESSVGASQHKAVPSSCTEIPIVKDKTIL